MQHQEVKLYETENELFYLIKTELYSAVIGDIMDKMGLLHQFLPPSIKPLRDDMFIAGRAMTVLEADVLTTDESASQNPVLSKPFGLMLEALDDLKANEIYVCTGSSPQYALWGEIMSARAQHLRAAGAIVNGYSRDTQGILALDFPCFSMGRYAQDQAPRGKVIDWRVPIRIGQAQINPGDIIMGDLDGVCVIPREHEAEIICEAVEKARAEKTVLEQIRKGMSAREAFGKYGIM